MDNAEHQPGAVEDDSVTAAAADGSVQQGFEQTREVWLHAERRYEERPRRKSRDRPSLRAPAAEGESYYEGIKNHPENGLIPELIDEARAALRTQLAAERSAAARKAGHGETQVED